ncbi:MAG: hypothetical protein N4A74_16485 [Carboxylicivirga sp.]|jgi:hypothetical protein|nr:hypothetical protein [Carboxylicivirga sp.]
MGLITCFSNKEDTLFDATALVYFEIDGFNFANASFNFEEMPLTLNNDTFSNKEDAPVDVNRCFILKDMFLTVRETN